MSKFVDRLSITDESGNIKKEININFGDPLAREQSQKAMRDSEQAKQTANESKQIAQEAKDAVPGEVSQQVAEATQELSEQIAEAKQTADEAKQTADDTGVVDGYVKYIILNEEERTEEKETGPCILSLEYQKFSPAYERPFNDFKFGITTHEIQGHVKWYYLNVYAKTGGLIRSYEIVDGYNNLDISGNGSVYIKFFFDGRGYKPRRVFYFDENLAKLTNAVSSAFSTTYNINENVENNASVQRALISAVTTYFQTSKKPYIINRYKGSEDYSFSYTTKLSNVPSMFKGKTELEDIIYLDCENVTDISDVFTGCSGLKKLYISNLLVSANGLISAFNNLYELVDLRLINTDLSGVNSIKDCFRGMAKIKDIDLSEFKMPVITSMSGAFSDCVNLRSVIFGSFGKNSPIGINFDEIFNNAFNLRKASFSNNNSYNTYDAKSATRAFYMCKKLEIVDWSHVSFEQCTGLSQIYSGCSSLNTIRNMYDVKVSYSISDSPLLSRNSARDCIEKLYDLTEGGTVTEYTAQTLTFHPDVTAQLTEEEIAEATAKGWNIA